MNTPEVRSIAMVRRARLRHRAGSGLPRGAVAGAGGGGGAGFRRFRRRVGTEGGVAMTGTGATDPLEGAASPPAGEAPRRTRRGRVRSEEARQAILSAAWDLVDEAGVPRLTMGNIAARAELTKATPYPLW